MITRLLLASTLLLSLVLLPYVLMGCGDVSISVPPPREGDDPGECTDGADNDGNNLYDCADPACSGAPECAENAPPGSPVVTVQPLEPTTSDSLTCVVDVAAVDPEGDLVSYTYSWTIDGADAGMSETSVDPGQTARDEVWMCTVVPMDELENVGPSASAAVTIGNSQPTPPEVSIEPSSPVLTDNLHCVVTADSEDDDGDDVGYELQWVRNGAPTGYTEDMVPAQATEVGDLWTCSVTPNDGYVDGPQGEIFVEIHVDVFPHTAVGRDHTCGVQMDGNYNCWGSNSDSQLNGPDISFWKLSGGPDFTCGIAFGDTSASCWGNNDYNQSLSPLGGFVDVAAGDRHACGARSTGELEAWGNAVSWPESPPSTIATGVAAGNDYCCGHSAAGEIDCWGSGAPLGQDTNVWQQIDGGPNHLCAVSESGSISCWGDDSSGQSSGAPSDGSYSFVSAGDKHSCALEADTGFVTCWGDNSYGQSSPPSGEFIDLRAGWVHTCGKRSNDTIECWGCSGDDAGQCDTP